jgi:comEA protein
MRTFVRVVHVQFARLVMLSAVLLCIPQNGFAQATDAGVQAAPSGVVNLNTASSEELERLPGIGPSRAKAILELRARIKRFARIEDVLRVKGIGRATFRRLRPYLSVEGSTTL